MTSCSSGPSDGMNGFTGCFVPCLFSQQHNNDNNYNNNKELKWRAREAKKSENYMTKVVNPRQLGACPPAERSKPICLVLCS